MPVRHTLAAIAAALAMAAAHEARADALHYPPTPKKPVTDTYHGIQVVDDYRWLEDGNDPAVKAWSAEETALTHRVLDAEPRRAALVRRFKALLGAEPVRYFEMYRRGAFFAMKRQPPKNQPFLVVMKSAGDVKSERVLVDPNRIDPKGTTAIDFYVPSLDGRYVAVAMSKDGSESGPAVVYDVRTGKRLPDRVPRVEYPTGGGSIEWDAGGSGFYYTRYPQGDERPRQDANFYQQVYFHALGTAASADRYVIGKEFPRIAETQLHATEDGRYLLASVADGDGGKFSYYLRDPEGSWSRIADDDDGIRHVELGVDGRLYALSLHDAPRGKVLATPLAHPDLAHAKVVVPEGDATVEALRPAKTRLYVTYMVGGPSEVRVFDLAGNALGTLPTEPVSTIIVGARLAGDEVLVATQSYVSAPAWYRYSPASGKLVRTPLAGRSKVSFADAVVVREMATSKDGTKVPVNIIMKKGTRLDGSNPTILYGYGGYGVNEEPYFSPVRRVWLDHGGIFVDANLRGGGEFGEAWHLAGNLTHKQNVFDDMIACAEHLIARGYTRPAKLAALGGSNGGLLMGAILTQRPDLFRAVVSEVGIYDMLRVELTPNGAFNVTEFGSVKDPEQFKAMYAYSPYQHVKDGTAYPAVLLTAGANDGRVDPYNSRKMAARLQAATSSGRPILLRMSADTGHGIGTGLGERVEEYADIHAFLMSQLGMR
ncbi:MAG TPA: prolyl oligopeptidase family serine peptidase [Usitatibacter sp.]|nr:prolyl oligopeptidase family serine peptidase [Usitatibacter sp.]